MSGAAKVYTATDVTLYVDGEELPPVAINSAPLGYASMYTGVIDFTAFRPPLGQADPQWPAVVRWVAARPFVGPQALMRRFGIGRQRARWLLVELGLFGVVRGHYSRLALAGHLAGRTVYAYGMYRVNRQAWRDLQGGYPWGGH